MRIVKEQCDKGSCMIFVVSDSNTNNWWWRVNLGKEYQVRVILVFADNGKTLGIIRVDQCLYIYRA